jgi:3-hydroxyisobutyrate dehydrogenase
MTERAYDPHFVLKLMLKDLTYAAAEGARNGVELKTAAAAGEVFSRAVESGHGEKDVSAVVEQFR